MHCEAPDYVLGTHPAAFVAGCPSAQHTRSEFAPVRKVRRGVCGGAKAEGTHSRSLSAIS